MTLQQPAHKMQFFSSWLCIAAARLIKAITWRSIESSRIRIVSQQLNFHQSQTISCAPLFMGCLLEANQPRSRPLIKHIYLLADLCSSASFTLISSSIATSPFFFFPLSLSLRNSLAALYYLLRHRITFSINRSRNFTFISTPSPCGAIYPSTSIQTTTRLCYLWISFWEIVATMLIYTFTHTWYRLIIFTMMISKLRDVMKDVEEMWGDWKEN